MALTYTNYDYDTTGGGPLASASIAYAAGQPILVFAGSPSAAPAFSISDTAGLTWSTLSTQTGATGASTSIVYLATPVSSGSTVVSVNASGAAVFGFRVKTHTGATTPIVVGGAGPGTQTAYLISQLVNPTSTGSALYLWIAAAASESATPATPGTGCTQMGSSYNAFNNANFELLPSTNPLTSNAAFTLSTTTASGYSQDLSWIAIEAPALPTGPIINTQPVSQRVVLGSTATMSVTATTSGGTVTYQWQKNTGSGMSNITGATSASYTTPGLAYADNSTTYQCVTTDSNGSTTTNVVSAIADFNTVGTPASRHITAFGAGSFGAGSFGPVVMGIVASGGNTYTAAVAETGTAAETSSTLNTTTAARVEAAAAVDISSTTNTTSAGVAEAGAAADSAGASNSMPAATAEAGAAADTSSTVNATTAATTEAGAAADISSVTDATTATVAEAAAAADTSSTVNATTAARVEAAAAAEVISVSFTTSATTSESGTAADTSETGAVTTVSILESGAAVDISVNVNGTTATVAEAAAGADTSSAANTMPTAVAESGAAADTSSAADTMLAATAEAAAAADTASASAFNGVVMSERATAADTSSATDATTAAVSELAAAADISTATSLLVASVTEASFAIDVSDAHAAAIQVGVIEQSDAQDTSYVLPSNIYAQVSEIMSAADTVRFEFDADYLLDISEIIPLLFNLLVGGRVWQDATPDILPRDTNGNILPFILWSIIGGQDQEYVEQVASDFSNARIQIHSVSMGVLISAQLAVKARDALLASPYTVGVLGSAVATYDATRKLRGRRQQFSIWFRQPQP